MKTSARLVGAICLLVAGAAHAAPPAVTSVYPSRQRIDAGKNTIIEVHFDHEIAAASVTPTSFRVFGRWSGPASGTFTVAASTVTFKPSQPFFAGEWITVLLSKGNQNTTGENMLKGYAWNFWFETASGTLTLTYDGRINVRQGAETWVQVYGAYAGDLNNDGWTGGIQSLFGIRADLCTYGKVVGGGFPIGVIAGRREFMDALDGGQWQYGDDSIPTVGVTYFAGTFVRHPLALAAGKAVLELLKEAGPELQATLTRTTAAMVDELNAFCRENGAPIALKSFASVWRISFTEDHPLQDLLFAMMRSRGVHILDNFPCFFTTAHAATDVAVIKSAFKESVLELQEADFLPRRLPAAAGTLDAGKPPVPGARIGRDRDGNPAWFVPNPEAPGKILKIDA